MNAAGRDVELPQLGLSSPGGATTGDEDPVSDDQPGRIRDGTRKVADDLDAPGRDVDDLNHRRHA